MDLRTSFFQRAFLSVAVLAESTSLSKQALAQENIQRAEIKHYPKTLHAGVVTDFIDKNRPDIEITLLFLVALLVAASIANNNKDLPQETKEGLKLMQKHALAFLEQNVNPTKLGIVKDLKKALETQLEENGVRAVVEEYKELLEKNLTTEELRTLDKIIK